MTGTFPAASRVLQLWVLWGDNCKTISDMVECEIHTNITRSTFLASRSRQAKNRTLFQMQGKRAESAEGGAA